MLKIKPTGQHGFIPNSNEAVAGTTTSEAFVKWLTINMDPSNCHWRGAYSFAV